VGKSNKKTDNYNLLSQKGKVMQMDTMTPAHRECLLCCEPAVSFCKTYCETKKGLNI